jgi:hypothetical protein
MPFSHKKVDGKDYYRIRNFIQPGTVLLTNIKGEFSNLYNPEKIKHGAIYVGRILGNEVCYVLESTRRGVILTDLVTFMLRKDFVIGYSPRFEIDIAKIQHKAKEILGTKYDYMFNKNNERLYCFESVAVLLEYASNEKIKLKKTLFGKMIYSYRSYTEDSRFEKIFDSEEL